MAKSSYSCSAMVSPALGHLPRESNFCTPSTGSVGMQKIQLPGLFPSPFREVVGIEGNLGPHAFQFPARDRDQLRLEQEAGGGVGGEHALGVAQKPRAIGV